ncbi:LysM peptidoglycan-binding domain-containing protein [Bacillus haynesii]|uniref:LysM peptidoglycan-binding domain-containing protein n=2 Tax=Bacillus haynesii TaxID=1925021 RepID=A0AA90JF26_9BACI|nr:C40 family peptidase [Bacillus haynesii]EWH22361.1 peptidoglycan-binding protein [Bacillus haynesii]MCY7816508.1 LysM peptidoglycan-binding domain-containing protein [Bacillus haynesii]MCY7849471.1 LysM peptidoglycan-binding domain-containing protein [Bacillus haynesii]MCY8001903.1 LysM peptidoglycan-binding domain-containing protein [Bacillus haynesii]MCY8005922.1 LysM peptidoglycan-binding domain-containing protein [Bacillus haynesii]
MKKQVITAASAVVLGSTLFAGAASAQTITVKKGDTLWGFSKKYGTSVSKIKQENKLNSDIIYIGQRLSINGSSSSSAKASQASSATHKVVKGDSLWKISRTYGMTVNELKSLNGLKTDLIRIGQVLKVKGTKSVKAASTTKPSASSGTSKTSKAPAQTSSALNTSKLVSDAKALIGTPYKWGGTSTSGFDCSGFVWYILNKQTNVARTNTVGYWNSMKSVSSPAVGDFVFFTTYQPGPSHMGVYIGNNQFVHAGSDGVTISDMTNSYWKPRYLGAKRF